MTTPKPKRFKILRGLGTLLLCLIIALVLGGTVLAARAALIGTKSEYLAPEGFTIYASAPSASRLAIEIMQQEGIDQALTATRFAPFRGLLHDLKTNKVLNTPWFKLLAGFKLDIAIYQGNQVLAMADLGIRAGITPPLQLLLKHAPHLCEKVPGLSYNEGTFTLVLGSQRWYLRFLRDHLLCANTELLLNAAEERLQENSDTNAALNVSLGRLLKTPSNVSVRVLADPSMLRQFAGEGVPGRLLSSLVFEGHSVLDIRFRDDGLGAQISTKISSPNQDVAALFTRRSSIPSVLSRFPAHTANYTLLSIASPGELWQAVWPFMDSSVQNAWNNASRGLRTVFGADIESLLFSWMGNELGMYISSEGPAPIYFTSIKDEKKREAAFSTLFNSFAASADSSTMVAGLRLQRIVFPPLLKSLASSMKISLMEPFYTVEDGVLYACASAEILAAAIREIRDRDVLVKEDRWKESRNGVSAESSASVFYNLDIATPFFLRGDSFLAEISRIFPRGIASLRTDGKGSLFLELSALHDVSSSRWMALPGFPIPELPLPDSPLYSIKDKAGRYYAFWAAGSSICSLELSSGKLRSLETDDTVFISPELDAEGNFLQLWAVSKRGSVYLCDEKLKSSPSFPFLSGEDSLGPIHAMGNAVYISSAKTANILRIDTNSTITRSPSLHTPPRSNSTAAYDLVAALPRSFDSQLYLWDANLQSLPNWPRPLSSICGSAPLIFEVPHPRQILVTAITDGGSLHVFDTSGKLLPGFPVQLNGSHSRSPIWAPNLRSLFILSNEGRIWRVNLEGDILQSMDSGVANAPDAVLSALNLSGDSREEFILGGGGDMLRGWNSEFLPLEGFPLQGTGTVRITDINRDNRPELLVFGLDSSLHAWMFP